MSFPYILAEPRDAGKSPVNMELFDRIYIKWQFKNASNMENKNVIIEV